MRVGVYSGLSNKYHYYDSSHSKIFSVSLEQPQEAQDKLEEALAEACIKLGAVREYVNKKEQEFKSFRFGEKLQSPPIPFRRPRRRSFFERLFSD